MISVNKKFKYPITINIPKNYWTSTTRIKVRVKNGK